MADSSLDSFFAKKDKSKKSKNKKFGTNAPSSNASEEGVVKSEKPSRKDKEKSSNNNLNTNNSNQNNEEWHEYDDKEKDYSGLKIQTLQINEKEDSEKESEVEFDEDGEPVKKDDGQAGPWKVVSSETAQPETPEVKEEEPKPKSTGPTAYVPPHLKKGLDRAPMKKNRFPKSAPKLDCQSDFPSLSSAVDSSGKIDTPSNSNFEQVKNRTRREESNRNSGPKLDLGNKYNALGASDNL